MYGWHMRLKWQLKHVVTDGLSRPSAVIAQYLGYSSAVLQLFTCDCLCKLITKHTYHGVMFFSDILQQGINCLRTDGAHNCTRYLFPNSSFPAIARAAMKQLERLGGKNLEIFLMNIKYFSVCSCKIKQTIKLWHNNFMWNS